MFKNKLKISPQLIELLLKISFIGIIGVAFLDVIKYFGFISNHFKISTFILVGIMAIIHLIIRLKSSVSLGENFSKTMIILFFPIILITSFVMFYLEEYGHLYPNYFFAEFKIQYGSLSIMSLFFLVFGLIHTTKKLWQENYKSFIFVLSFGLLMGAVFFNLEHHEAFVNLRKEDDLIEILQALLLGTSSVICWKLRKKAISFLKDSKVQQKIASYLLLAAFFVFVLAAGEEISWGQRILGISTPENLAEVNTQGEINLHNNKAIWPFVYWGYFVVGLLGASLWTIKWFFNSNIKQNKFWNFWINLLVPNGYLMLNFLTTSLYAYLRFRNGIWKYIDLEELSELLLCIGVIAHLTENLWSKTYVSFKKK